MHRSPLNHRALALLLALAALSQVACEVPPECDPHSEEFNLAACYDRCDNETPKPRGCNYVTTLEGLNNLAYGLSRYDREPSANTCPPDLICYAPDCFGWVQQNGGFERPHIDRRPGPVDRRSPTLWYGDDVLIETFSSCQSVQSLAFVATTPNGPSASVSAQVFQVFDYRELIPEADQARLRRVRMQAAIHANLIEDRLFGVLIQAYAGDPANFPLEGDPEEFLPTIPGLLAENVRRMRYTGDAKWQPVQAELWLPEDTDYFVVVLEAVEDVQNDVTEGELEGQYMDAVQVIIDGGNTAPVAAPDQVQTPEAQPVDIPVLRNDLDNTSGLDPASVTLVRAPASGIATVLASGLFRYTPTPVFLGTDTFTYTVADEEGLRSNEATVTVEVYRRSTDSCTFQSQFICTAVGPPFCEQRVIRGDFVGFTYDLTNLPTRAGRWSGFGLAAVGPSQGIIPCQGSQMLQFVSTADNNSAEIFLPIVQLVDLSDAAAQAAISGGNVTLKARALFNRIAGDTETDTRFDIAVRAYEGDPSEYPQQVGTPLGSKTLMLFSDADPETWEEAYVALTLDTRTTYVAVQLYPYENVVNDFPPAIEFDGHYVDNVRVVLDRE